MLLANFLALWAFSSEVITFIRDPESENVRNVLLVALWCTYGLGLLIVGIRKNWDWLRVAGYALAVVSTGATLTLLNHSHAMVSSVTHSVPILNWSLGGFAICVVALYLYAYAVARNRELLHDFEKVVCVVVLAVATVLTLWGLSEEIVTFLDGNLQKLMLVILLSGYGLLLMLAGVWKGVPAARFAAYALVATAVGMASIMLNHGRTGLQRSDYYVLVNPSFGGFLVCVIALYLTSYLMGKNSSKLLDAEKPVLTVLIVAANALSLFALSSEVLTYASAGYGQSMGLTMLWASYGLAVMVVGIVGKWPWVRLGGLALVSVAILKLFLWDTFHLQSGYRVAAYLTLGVLLLAGGFVYHRYADVIKGFIMDRPEKGAGSARK